MTLIVVSPPPAPANVPIGLSSVRALLRPGGRWGTALLLAAYCGFLFFYGLTAGELYRTENLRAIIAAEFLRSGDWIVPKLYGQPLFTKPPGMYAAIALVSAPFGGVTEWTARLPSALAATITVFLFYGYFSRQLGRLGGLVAAAIFPASFMWLDKIPTAEIDALQVAWVTGALLCFLRALEIAEAADDSERRSGLGWWLAALLCVAGGVLTKWTAPAFFYGTVVPLLGWRGRLRLLFGRNHLLSAALAASLCLAWIGAAVTLAGWDAFYTTVSQEALQRLSPGHHQQAIEQMSPGHHPRLYPWGEVLVHPLKILATNLPWSAFALLTLRPGFARQWNEGGRRLLQALHCWTWANLLFWSIIPEHAPRHSFPLFPGFAGLAAMAWVAWLRQAPTSFSRAPRASATVALARGARPNRIRWAFVALLAAWLLVKLLFVEVVIPARNPNRAPREKGEQLAAVVPAGEMLYLFRLKDEGIMFYYGRPVLRLLGPEQLPSSPEPLYCILDESEWQQWHPGRPAEALLRLQDEQGQPIVLVRVSSEAGTGS